MSEAPGPVVYLSTQYLVRELGPLELETMNFSLTPTDTFFSLVEAGRITMGAVPNRIWNSQDSRYPRLSEQFGPYLRCRARPPRSTHPRLTLTSTGY